MIWTLALSYRPFVERNSFRFSCELFCGHIWASRFPCWRLPRLGPPADRKMSCWWSTRRAPDSLCIANYYASLRHISEQKFPLPRMGPDAGEYRRQTFRDEDSYSRAQDRKTADSRPADRLHGLLLRLPLGHSHRRRYQEIQGRAGEGGAGKGRQVSRRADEKSPAKPPAWLTYDTPVASINGLTYLYRAGDSRRLLHPSAEQLVRPHRSAGTGQGAEAGILQPHGLMVPWRGGSGTGRGTTCCR